MNIDELHEKIQTYSKNISLLLVDDDEIVLEIYADSLGEFIPNIEVARDGKEAYEMIKSSKNGYDIVLTDIMMPRMNGFELIKEVKKDFIDQRFMVLTSLGDLNEMHEIINLGVDAILQKPYSRDSFVSVFYRVAKSIFHEKILKTRARQLMMLTQEKIALKKSAKSSLSDKEKEQRVPKVVKHQIKPESSQKVEKYNTRASITGVSAGELLFELDILNLDKIDIFQDKLIDYEVLLCNSDKLHSPKQIKENIKHVSLGLENFVETINVMGKFPVAVNAAKHLIDFMDNLNEEEFLDKEKKELAIDALLYIIQDIYEWIVTVFVKQEAQNVNYFDASFANSCMEFEMLFNRENSNIESSDDDLEFF